MTILITFRKNFTAGLRINC